LEKTLAAIDELDKTFVVEEFELKADALDKMTRAAPPPPPGLLRALFDSALALADEAVEEDQYDASIKFLNVAKTSASKLNSSSTFTQVNQRIREVSEIQRESLNAKPASDTLTKMPDDPEASYRWGRFLTLFKRAWTKGVPLLAQGSPPQGSGP